MKSRFALREAIKQTSAAAAAASGNARAKQAHRVCVWMDGAAAAAVGNAATAVRARARERGEARVVPNNEVMRFCRAQSVVAIAGRTHTWLPPPLPLPLPMALAPPALIGYAVLDELAASFRSQSVP